MEGELLVFTVRVDMIQVYTFEMHPVTDWGTAKFEIPPGVIKGDYKHLQIEVEKKGGE